MNNSEIKKISVKDIIVTLDEFFSKNDLNSALNHLLFWENEAKKQNDLNALSQIYNEEIGLFRRLQDKENCIKTVNAVIDILENGNFKNGISVATIFVNIATAFKEFDFLKSAEKYYEKAERIYIENSFLNDYKTAALFNNRASLFWELQQYENALNYYFKAIKILKEQNIKHGEIAISLLNCAHIYYEQNPFDEKINPLLDEAYEFLNHKNLNFDGSYAFVCSKCAPSYSFFGQFLRAEELEKRAKQIYERN